MRSGPLAGKTILVTRAKEQAKEVTQLIEKQGGTTIEIPLIAFQSTINKKEADVLQHIGDYQWLIFTSSNGVRFFMDYYIQHGDRDLLKKINIAVVGTKTEETLNKYQLAANIIPQEFVAEGLIEALKGQIKKDDKVLVARGNLGRMRLINELTKLGAVVTDLTVYETFLPKKSSYDLLDVLKTENIDYVTFTSSSTVHNYIKSIEPVGIKSRNHPIIACIGPIAAKTAESYGLKVEIVPRTYTIEHFIKEIVRHSKEEKEK
ncbi:uroporphyrinogen-III methyltransferase [Halalkalibacter wakoensis JCM 9140]|uniref:Uroporphyrinogen-III synthase n=1 Tax=Halalkalibacter wakoensis JCM 9140 TaxID=1236970 RepID=W4Q7G0_9BACI|nr:uroporphyrinogen-III synthase [Halalkalibacter wakoensis]GAE27319.1 uroporphyrinogen-III methyltransferase [Halalkalibacter wakoensis JCM 9140]